MEPRARPRTARDSPPASAISRAAAKPGKSRSPPRHRRTDPPKSIFGEGEDAVTTPEIIGVPGSIFVRTARIACVEKGVAYTLTPVRPHSPEASAIHPFGKIPAFRHGELTLCESRAICCYLDMAFPGPPLVPRDPVGAAVCE